MARRRRGRGFSKWSALYIVGLILGIGAVMSLALFQSIVKKIEERRYEIVTEALSCNTADSTACSMTLPSPHVAPDTDELFVRQVNPSGGDRTSESTLGEDGLTLVVSGLSRSTDYDFQVRYERKRQLRADRLNKTLGEPPILFMVIAAIGLIGTAATWKASYNM